MNFDKISNYIGTIFNYKIGGNTISAYFISIFIAIVGVLLVVTLRGILMRLINNWVNRKTIKPEPRNDEPEKDEDSQNLQDSEFYKDTPKVETPQKSEHGRVDHTLIKGMVESLLSVLRVVPVYWAVTLLSMTPQLWRGVSFMFLLLFAFRTAKFVIKLIVVALDASLSTENARARRKALTPIISVVIWVIAIIFVLDNLGMKISSIVAGLGIVGVAVGLAGQTILADFFGYLIILLDRPFKIGDSLSIDGNGGVVEQIGIKTTHIRSFTGELMVIPNGDLTKKSLSNYQAMNNRSRRFRFEVVYSTPHDKLRNIPGMIRQIVNRIPGATLQRAHFIEFAASGLNFEVSFMVESREYVDLLDAQQKINLAIIERFEKEGIEFAFPTQTIHIQPSTLN